MSVQVNVRLDQELLDDIDAMAKVMHISRSDYINLKIAKALQEDSLNMTDTIILEYARGRISEYEVEALLGNEDVVGEKMGLAYGWKGALRKLKKKYTSVELQHKAVEWR